MKSYFKVFYEDLLESFKLNKNMLYSLGFDLLFVVLFFVGLFIWATSIFTKAETFHNLNYSVLFTFNKAGIEQIYNVLSEFILFLIFVSFLFWLYVIAIFSFTQSNIWFSYSRKKRTIKTFLKVLFMNFVIITPCILSVIYMMIKQKEEGVLLYILLFAVMLHFLGIMNLHFAYHHKVKRAFYKIFEHGILKIHHFIVPYFMMICFYFLLIVISLFVSHYTGISHFLLTSFLLILFSAYVRNYFVIIAKREVKDA